MRRLLCLCTLVLVAACGGTTVDVTAFDQSCKVASDCVPVVDGSVCGCDCPNAAINKADLATYTQAEEAAAGRCAPMGLDCVECPGVAAVCEQGKCAVH